MGATKSIARYVANEIGGPFLLNGHLLHVPLFEYFAQGLLIEQSPYKYTVNLRQFLLPFFSMPEFLHVSYSPRLRADLIRGVSRSWVALVRLRR